MIAKRLGAVVAAIALIAGAWFVRTRVIDDGDTGTASSTGAVVCVKDLEDICRAVGNALDVEVRIESVDVTLAAWGSADTIPEEVWITMAPFPEMATSLRTNARLTATDVAVETVASSPLALVVNADIAAGLTVTCDDPVDWRCLGTETEVKVGFAPFPHTAIGQLGVTTAVLGFENGSVPTPSDPAFTIWARQISKASSNSPTANSAVSTIQTRRSSFDLAVGAVAELVDPTDQRFVQLAPSETTSIDVVVATPAGTSAPAGSTSVLRDALTNAGWTAPATASTTLSSDAMLAVREIWKPYS